MKESTAYHRAEMPSGTGAVLEVRTLENSNANLLAELKEGLQVLDVGCGTGAITRGIANYVGEKGKVIGIDRSPELIALSGKYAADHPNLQFEVADIMEYQPERKFDLITITRTLQWMASPESALKKMISLLKQGGRLCVLDYNHMRIEWEPAPPFSMQLFYDAFLRWRENSGMDNAVGDHVEEMLLALGGQNLMHADYNEFQEKGQPGFINHVSIWQKVAETRGHQMVKDNYIEETLRLKAIDEYSKWIKTEAKAMKLFLKASHASF